MRVTSDADLMRHIDARRYVMMHTCGPLAASHTGRTDQYTGLVADGFLRRANPFQGFGAGCGSIFGSDTSRVGFEVFRDAHPA